MNGIRKCDRRTVLNAVFTLSVSVLACACAETGDQVRSRTLAINLGGLKPVSQFVSESGANTPLLDTPATYNFTKLEQLFASNQHTGIVLGVYAHTTLASPSTVLSSRATKFSISGTQYTGPNDRYVAIESGTKQIRINKQSGSELLLDWSTFHAGAESSSLQSTSTYVSNARSYVDSAFSGVSAAGGLYAYKFRKYMSADGDDDDVPTAVPYQVAVALNDTVDDLPIIGPGGKVSIHMTVSGTAISHEANLRDIGTQITTVSGSGLLRPSDAQDIAEGRLASRGLAESSYTLVRAEFGYLRYGRMSIQEIVAPHYAFVFEPASGVSGPRISEVVVAVTNTSLISQIEGDHDAELDRKDALHGDQAPHSR